LSSVPSWKAFSLYANRGLLKEVRSDIIISEPLDDTNPQVNIPPNSYKTTAIWDTGATCCAIHPSVARHLNLRPISLEHVKHAGGTSLRNVYLISIFLPNNIALSPVRVVDCTEEDLNFGILIGMDIITQGDFSITNVKGNTTVSFRMPSIKKIDYVEEWKEKTIQAKLTTIEKVPSPNSFCPCGSGKKYKHCHGRKR
jgi:uncharacterized protein YchJ